MQCSVCGAQNVKLWEHDFVPHCAVCIEACAARSGFRTEQIAQTEHLPCGSLQRLCANMDSIDAMFAELRSVHQKPHNISAIEWVWFLSKAHTLDPQKYKAQWLPYLLHMDLPPLTVGAVDGLHCASPRMHRKSLPRLFRLFPKPPRLHFLGNVEDLQSIHEDFLHLFDDIFVQNIEVLSDDFFGQPGLSNLKRLTLLSAIGIEHNGFDFGQLTRSNHLHKLEHLHLLGWQFADHSIHDLVISDTLKNLKTLHLSGTHISVGGINDLLAAHRLNIETLLIDRHKLMWSPICPVPTSYRLPLKHVELQTVNQQNVPRLNALFGHLGDHFIQYARAM